MCEVNSYTQVAEKCPKCKCYTLWMRFDYPNPKMVCDTCGYTKQLKERK